MSNDTISKTLLVAFLICLAGSVLVSGSAVLLRPRQIENKKLDVKKSLLLACGLLDNRNATKEEIELAFSKIESEIIDLSTGEKATDIDAETFDQRKAAKDPKMSKVIASSDDLAKIKRRSKYAKVYTVKEDGVVKMIVLPVNGKGLWSTLYGFLALSPDTKTILGFGFYQHAETPGLGGEVDNPRWKASWKGKIALDDNYVPIIKVMKGRVNTSRPQAKHQVDGLSGATLTSNGVTGLVRYWLGNDGLGKYLARVRAQGRIL